MWQQVAVAVSADECAITAVGSCGGWSRCSCWLSFTSAIAAHAWCRSAIQKATLAALAVCRPTAALGGSGASEALLVLHLFTTTDK